MSAYFIARVRISDRNQYAQYLAAVPSIITRYNGKVIARTEQPVSLEGPDESRRIIVIEFPSVDQAKQFYTSPEYSHARTLREHAAEGEIVVIDGVQ